MKKRTIYTEVLSENKRKAPMIALEKFPQFELKEIEVPKISEMVPMTAEETELLNIQKIKNLWSHITDANDGDIVLSIQKGVHLHPEGCILVIAVSDFKIEASSTECWIETCVSEEIILPSKLYSLVHGGMKLYDAYAELFGEEIKNKSIPLSEFMTDEKEEFWIARAITKELLTTEGKHSALFKLT